MNSTTPTRRRVCADDPQLTESWDCDPRSMLTITTVERPGGAADLHLTGELDLSTTVLLRAAARSALAAGMRTLCLDLGRISFCDCAALGTLVTIQHLAHDNHGSFRLRNIPPQLRRLMALVHLDTLQTDDGPGPAHVRAPGVG